MLIYSKQHIGIQHQTAYSSITSYSLEIIITGHGISRSSSAIAMCIAGTSNRCACSAAFLKAAVVRYYWSRQTALVERISHATWIRLTRIIALIVIVSRKARSAWTIRFSVAAVVTTEVRACYRIHLTDAHDDKNEHDSILKYTSYLVWK
jgi:hypothetical protein